MLRYVVLAALGLVVVGLASSAEARARYYVVKATSVPAPKGTKCVAGGLSPGCSPGSCRCDYF
jgi:hypothetical protein